MLSAQRISGLTAILASIMYVAVFSWLAVNFGYPDILDKNAAEVLVKLQQLGSNGRLVWGLYAFIPLLLLPVAVAVRNIVQHSSVVLTLAMITLSLSALVMHLGLLRWPSVMWYLAQSHEEVLVVSEQSKLIFDVSNIYLGNFLGELSGEILMSVFFMLFGVACLQYKLCARWVALYLLMSAVFTFAGSLRIFSENAKLISDFNNLAMFIPISFLIVGGIIIINDRAVKSLSS